MNEERKRILAVRIFADPIIAARDILATLLVKAHVTPNILTVLGTIFTVIAAYTLARGAEQTWSEGTIPGSFWAGVWLLLACSMDMLDGAVAKRGNLQTRFGGILDSTMDRLSDVAIFGGISLAYARLGNRTGHLLALIALTNAVLISYIKARAENEIADCSVGFWQRGERMVAVLIGCFAGHVGTVIVILAVFPVLTVASRLRSAYHQLVKAPAEPGRQSSRRDVAGLAFWRCERGSWPHAVLSAICILILVFVDVRPADWLSLFE